MGRFQVDQVDCASALRRMIAKVVWPLRAAIKRSPRQPHRRGRPCTLQRCALLVVRLCCASVAQATQVDTSLVDEDTPFTLAATMVRGDLGVSRAAVLDDAPATFEGALVGVFLSHEHEHEHERCRARQVLLAKARVWPAAGSRELRRLWAALRQREHELPENSEAQEAKLLEQVAAIDNATAAVAAAAGAGAAGKKRF